MITIELIDQKGEFWELIWANSITPSLYKGSLWYKGWWYAIEIPHELRNYSDIPLPVFTEWWPE